MGTAPRFRHSKSLFERESDVFDADANTLPPRASIANRRDRRCHPFACV